MRQAFCFTTMRLPYRWKTTTSSIQAGCAAWWPRSSQCLRSTRSLMRMEYVAQKKSHFPISVTEPVLSCHIFLLLSNDLSSFFFTFSYFCQMTCLLFFCHVFIFPSHNLPCFVTFSYFCHIASYFFFFGHIFLFLLHILSVTFSYFCHITGLVFLSHFPVSVTQPVLFCHMSHFTDAFSLPCHTILLQVFFFFWSPDILVKSTKKKKKWQSF